ncbi:glycerate kinase [Propionicimonas paludicola]|uniref:Glycerate kinase n=1 Tax=Propionicimonas paludicola TaxID=185243 RepID=A0A2A9CPS4_9ACTN|nr:glycerate kinase [Propionicimonas paludicola]PFG15612.1 glycerate kinase [Propionicimonas paludicola]
MRIVCAPDSFKGSMSALIAAQAMRDGVRRAVPDAECVLVPMADGGEGTVAALAEALGAELFALTATDALGRPVRAEYAYVAAQRLAVIEVAAAAGLALLRRNELDLARATTFGVGAMILDALDRGARRLIIGLGGSATNDAGAGLMTALGARFLDADGVELPPGGAALAGLARVDLSGLDPRLADLEVQAACDVENALLGLRGCSAVFGPQKGATTSEVHVLDAALSRWADVVEPLVGRRVRELPSSGAAGGLGAGLAAFLGAELVGGAALVADTVGLSGRMAGADWVFTGEGTVDSLTMSGKTPWGVLEVARQAGVPVIIFAGRVAPDASALLSYGVTALVPITPDNQTLSAALSAGPQNLATAAERVARLLFT